MSQPSISAADSGIAPWLKGVHVAVAAFALILGAMIALTPVYVPLVFFVSLILAAAFVIRPEISLLLVALAGPFINVQVSWGDWSRTQWQFAADQYTLLAVDFMVPALLLAIVAGRATKKVEPVPVIKSALPLLFIVLYGALTILWAKNKGVAFTVWLELVSCSILFYAPIILLRSEIVLKSFLWIWIFPGAVTAAVMGLVTLHYDFPSVHYFIHTLYSGITDIDFHVMVFDNIKQRISGFGEPNRVAYLLNTAMMGGLVLYLTAKSRLPRIILPPVMLFLGYVMVHALSRSELGGAAIIFTIFAMVHPSFNRRRLLAIAAFGLLMVSLIALMSYLDLKGGFGRFGNSPLETRGASSMALRFYWWGEDLKALVASDFIGTGLGGVYKGFAYAQSSYFSFLTDFGAAGFMLGMLFVLSYSIEIYTLLRKAVKSHLHFTAALAFALCVMLFMMHSALDFAYNYRVLWIMAGLALAMARLGAMAQPEAGSSIAGKE